MNDSTACPCNSGLSYSECCEPLIKGTVRAPGPEALMRARYSAFAHQEMPYLLETLHPGQRNDYDEEGAAKWARESDWTGLEILNVTGDPATENAGSVEFRATYKRNNQKLEHHELAEFRKTNDIWYFFDGKMVTPGQYRREAPKVGRNDPCPCGSGKKFKKCCDRAGLQK
jgi:SEC-C motif-containing protein